MATEVKRIKSNPNFAGFVHNLARTRGNELWGIVKPMMHNKTSRDWEDLYELMVKAHELAEMMYSGSEEYKFDFPIMGQPFRKDFMEVRDPHSRLIDPVDAERRSMQVRLGMTPLITIRQSTADGLVKAGTVLKAIVLLKEPRER
jgi:hypothetical protein